MADETSGGSGFDWVGSVLNAGLNFAVKSGLGALNRSWSTKAAKGATKRDLQNQALHENWYVRNIYPQYQEADYDMARRYAENSAQWEVQGLRNAGLNPILAATHGLGGAGVGYSAPSGSPSGSSGYMPDGSIDTPNLDLAEGVRDLASAAMARTDSKIKRDTAPSIVSSAKSDAALKQANVGIADATKRKIEAEVQQVQANTAKAFVDARNTLASQGMSSDLFRIATRALVSPFDSNGRKLYRDIDGKITTLLRSDNARSGNSAKTPPADVIEINTGKRDADFERDRLEMYRKMFLRGGH